jgi:hypothetical protein
MITQTTYRVVSDEGVPYSGEFDLNRAVTLAKTVDANNFTSDFTRPVAICDDYKKLVPSSHATPSEADLVLVLS